MAKMLTWVLLVMGGVPVWVTANFLWWRECAEWAASWGFPAMAAEGVFAIVGVMVSILAPFALVVHWEDVPEKYKRALGVD